MLARGLRRPELVLCLCVTHSVPSVLRQVRGTSQESSLHSAQAGTFIWVKVGTQC